MRMIVRVAVLALLGVAVQLSTAAAETAPAGTATVAGRWVGAKLRCQKEEGKLVRCGTPTSFTMALDPAGTGATSDDTLPKVFTWKWAGAGEIVVTPAGGGEEIKLFAVEQEDPDTLTFQAYVYLPTGDPNAPAESRYIHFVFDVSRAE